MTADVHQPLEEPALLMRCAALQAPDLNSYLEGGGFVGATTAADQSPLEVITTLRQAALRGRGREGGPSFLKWFAFSRARGPGCLVVDARQTDPRGQTNQALIEGNPFGLLEGLCIAALAMRVNRALVLLPVGARRQRQFLTTALEQYQALKPLEEQTPELRLEFAEEPGPDWPARQLRHCLETWHQITLVFILGVERFLALGMSGQGGTRLVTVGGAVVKPGLVEVPMGAHLWQVLDAAGGLSDTTRFHALCLDHGRAGFLSLEAAATPLAPEEMHSAGVNPAFGTLWALEEDACLVAQTGQALRLLEGEAGGQAAGQALSQARALVEELELGRGSQGHLDRLRELLSVLEELGSPAFWPLGSALLHFEPHWQEHLRLGACPFAPPRA